MARIAFKHAYEYCHLMLHLLLKTFFTFILIFQIDKLCNNSFYLIYEDILYSGDTNAYTEYDFEKCCKNIKFKRNAFKWS